MAETFPETLINIPNVTKGEIRVFDLLKNVLPNEEYIVWFEPKIENKIGRSLYPDIIIWSRVTGLVVLEIKDWIINDILECDPINIKMRKGSEVIKLKNPESQARDYVNNAMNSLRKINEFVTSEGKMKGRLKFPVGHGVVFTNITRTEIETKEINKVIKCEIFTKDEIEKIEGGGNDIILVSKLRRMGNFFPFDDLTNRELDKLRSVLFPRIIIHPTVIQTPNVEVKDKEVNYDTIKVLDTQQEKIAISLGAGHRIIKGAAGSGKTLVLAYRAVTLKKFIPNLRVLILCYNITLRNYIRDLLKRIGKEDDVDTSGIDVHYFHDFVYTKIGIPQLRHHVPKNIINKLFVNSNNWDEYQNLLGSTLINNLGFIPGEQYDAILVDECQDLTTDYLKFIVHLLNKDKNYLLIAIDPAQNLYGGKISWKSVGVNAKGRVTMLQTSYRNTKNILNLALQFNNQPIEKLSTDDSGIALFPDKTVRIGTKPKLIEFISEENMADYIKEEIQKMMLQYNYKFSDFGIIFPIKPIPTLLTNIKEKLDVHNINYRHIESKDDKKNFNINDESCKILNTFLVKGYEFKVVFLLSLERYSSIPENERLKRNNVYVGMTRAMNELQILALQQQNEATFITEIRAILEEIN